MIAWADGTAEEGDDDAFGTILVVLALVGLGAVLISVAMTAEADAPDDGIRLVSMQTSSKPDTSFGSFIKLLQHIEFGQKRNGDIYAGIRFQF